MNGGARLSRQALLFSGCAQTSAQRAAQPAQAPAPLERQWSLEREHPLAVAALYVAALALGLGASALGAWLGARP